MHLNVTCAEMDKAICIDSKRYERYNFMFNHNLTTLTIQDVQVEDYGMFILSASNPAGVSSYNHSLSVIGK